MSSLPENAGAAPEIAVVVPSHDRPIRLLWLLNALEEQTLEPARFEIVVAHDSTGPQTAKLLGEHPLTRSGTLRSIQFAPGAGPATKRNAGWRAARAPLVAFTDDDCRPPPEWLERALAAAVREPGAIVQGATRPDPDEAELLVAAPHSHSQDVTPPVVWAQTCNIVYPREVLERVGGFLEDVPVASGEDSDLALRARRSGVRYVGAPEVVTYHAVEARGLVRRLRDIPRWQHIALVIKRNPELREALVLRVFWTTGHLWFVAVLAGGLLGRRRRAALLAALPWVRLARPSYGRSPRGLARSALELPGRALVELVEVATLTRGSARYKTLVL